MHGGGGTAFPWAVKEWNARGFAAIAMDLEGHFPQLDKSHDKRSCFDGSGPQRREIFEDMGESIREQWFCQALGQIMGARSLLGDDSRIDSNRVGIMGISWGGILTCVTAGLDDRYNFLISVYGCGYLDESTGKLRTTEEMSRLWDPKHYLPRNRADILYVNGDKDPHFPLNTWEKTCRCTGGEVSTCLVPDMAHNHKAPYDREEIFAFALKERNK